MSSNLLRWPSGQIALRVAVEDQIKRRMRRFFKRNTNIAFDDWVASGKTIFDFDTVLDALNEDHDQEVVDLLHLLENFENDVITDDVSIYVDSATGNDVTGKGTYAQPFQTLGRAQILIPKNINAAVDIRLSGTFTAIRPIVHTIGPRGQLSFQSTDDPTVIDGPYAVATWTNVGVGQTFAIQVAVAGAPFIAEEHKGRFLRMLDGANAGAIYAIAHNDTNTFVIGLTSFPGAPGDSFDIVEPTTVIAPVDNTMIISIDETGIPSLESSFILAGISTTAFTTIYSKTAAFMHFPFCNIASVDLDAGKIAINEYDWRNPAIAVNAFLTDVRNNSTYFGFVLAFAHNSRIDRICSQFFYIFGGTLTLYRHLLETVFHYDDAGSGAYIYASYFHNAGSDAITSEGQLILKIYWVWFEQCANTITARHLNLILINEQGTIANISGVNMEIGPCAQVSFDGTPLSPAGGDVTWVTTGATVAFPAVAGTSITDANGSYVVKRT